MTQCAWSYVDNSPDRCKNDVAENEAMCKGHNNILDELDKCEDYSPEWEALVKLSNEIGR